MSMSMLLFYLYHIIFDFLWAFPWFGAGWIHKQRITVEWHCPSCFESIESFITIKQLNCFDFWIPVLFPTSLQVFLMSLLGWVDAAGWMPEQCSLWPINGGHQHSVDETNPRVEGWTLHFPELLTIRSVEMWYWGIAYYPQGQSNPQFSCCKQGGWGKMQNSRRHKILHWQHHCGCFTKSGTPMFYIWQRHASLPLHLVPARSSWPDEGDPTLWIFFSSGPLRKQHSFSKPCSVHKQHRCVSPFEPTAPYAGRGGHVPAMSWHHCVVSSSHRCLWYQSAWWNSCRWSEQGHQHWYHGNNRFWFWVVFGLAGHSLGWLTFGCFHVTIGIAVTVA